MSASATDLLSRVPDESTNSRALGLRYLRPSLPLPPFRQHACADVGTGPSTKAPNSRERHLRPRVTAWLVPRSPAVTCKSLVPVGGRPRLGTETYSQPFKPRNRSNDLVTDAPCHTPSVTGLRRISQRCQGSFPHTTHQPPWLSKPEATSTDGSHLPHPLLALRVRLRGRH